MRAVDPPAGVRQEYDGWTWSVAWSCEGIVTTWRLEAPDGEVRFLKVRAIEEAPRLLIEAETLAWARDHLPVATVLDVGTEGDIDWLVLGGLPGRDATDPALRAQPERLVPNLARGLRRFHQARG